MTQKHFRLFAYFSIAAYVVSLLASGNPFESISISISIAVVLDAAYATFLWRINPFEMVPRLKRKYHSVQMSSYAGGKKVVSEIKVRQTLFSISISEVWDGNHCASVSSSISKESNGDWTLIYTYLARPAARVDDHIDEIHYGTAILHIKSKNELSGSYYTNRQPQTRGSIVWEAT